MKDIVENGFCTRKESVSFESKRCKDKLPKNVWETYSAFANTSGGCIALGFTELPDGRLQLTGVENPEKIVKEFWDLIHDKKKASVNLLTDDDVRILGHNGLKYILIRVPRAERHSRPVYVNNDLDNGTYRRNNDGDYHCTVPEIHEMGRDASDVSADIETIPGTSIKDLNMRTVDNFKNHLGANNSDHPWLKEPVENFLRLIGAADMVKGELLLTNAGLLMFGNDYRITRTFPSYHLDCQEFKDGVEWSDRFFSDSGLWSGNLFDFYLEVSNRIFRANKHPFRLKGDVRTDTTDLIKAQREIVLNAIVHADYRGSTGITVEMRDDLLSVRNHGCFRIPPDKAMEGGHTDARNPTIMKMFNLVGFVERAGSGVYRIVRTCAENGLNPPRIEEETNPNVVVFTMKLNTTPDNIMENIVAMIRMNPKITMTEIAKRLHVSNSTVYRSIDRLKNDGVIERISGPKGHWKVNEE